jgi:hypothetical protein
MKDGFSNLSEECVSGDETENEIILEETSKKQQTTTSKKSKEQQQVNVRIDKGLESIDMKTKISVIERLKLDLTTYSVVGYDGSLNNYLWDNQDKQDNKLNKHIFNRRLRKSFKLLKEATEKMIFCSQTSSNTLNHFTKSDQGNSPNKSSIKSSNQNTSTTSTSIESLSATTTPLNGIIKQIDIASLILNSRELLIFLVNNWPKNSETITASHLNCKNETDIIEFLYLLYNSIDINKYKLIVHNIVSLLDVNSLSKICLLASNYLLPDYRFIKSIDWKSDLAHAHDSGEFKRNSICKKLNTTSSSNKRLSKIIKDDTEESINTTSGNNNGMVSEQNDLPLINPLSNVDYTLLIVFDFDKLKINNANNHANYHKLKQKYKGFKKHVNSMLNTDADTRQIAKDEEVEEEKKIDVTIVIDETDNVSHSTVSDEDANYREDNDEEDRFCTKKKKSKIGKGSVTKLLLYSGESSRDSGDINLFLKIYFFLFVLISR